MSHSAASMLALARRLEKDDRREMAALGESQRDTTRPE